MYFSHVYLFFHPRPVLASGYCCCCPSVCLFRQSVRPAVSMSVCQLNLNQELVRVITCQPFKLKSQKWPTQVQSTLVKILILLELDWKWPEMSNSTLHQYLPPFWACLRNDSSHIEVKISQYRPKMHLSTTKSPVDFGFEWHWPSISFLILEFIFLPNWAFCIHLLCFCLY